MAEAEMDHPKRASTQTGARPYRPGWVDHLTAWVERLPRPYGPFYAVMALCLFLPTGVWLIRLIPQRLLGS
jgi:hypothetical protein